MAFEVTFELNPTHVALRGAGVYTIESALDLIAGAFAAAKQQDVGAALIDVRAVEGMPAGMERFEIGRFIADHRVDGVRLAMVSNPAVAEPARFSEDVATNRGGQFRVFTDTERATAWLEDISV